jgi:hypothetical protein
MNRVAEAAPQTVSPDEEARRIQEYRLGGFQRLAPAQVVYHGDTVRCPWPGCDICIAGIRFRLEEMGDAPQVARWMSAWWKGPGLVARCPRCSHHVLFDITGKQTVSEPVPVMHAVLPEDWQAHAHLVVKPEC